MSTAQSRTTWQVAGASVRGTRHCQADRNNQDAFFWDWHGDVLALCVADGCSSAAHSEAGALLGVRSAVRHMLGVMAGAPAAAAATIVAQVHARTYADICRLADIVGPSAEPVHDHLLFTLVGALVAPDRVIVWALGDGVVIVNGQIILLESEDNRPRYAAYGAAGPEDRAPVFGAEVIWQGPAAGVRSLLIGTDGVQDLIRAARQPLPGREDTLGDIGQFWTDDAYFRNPDQVRRRLALASRDVRRPDWAARTVSRSAGLLPDDTTLVVVRRPHAAAETGADARRGALACGASL